MLRDKLEVFIITYNRKKHLAQTLECVYSENSPIKDFQITILDNKSTDGTSELIDKAISNFPNSKHVIHNRNIGGNANIARCYELAKKEYFWILCDDDEINFKNWAAVEKAILEENADCVVVSNYIHPKRDVAQLIGQLSFVPAGIYKTENLTDTVMQNIGFQISCCFPQLALVCKLINDGKKFVILDDWIVKMIVNPDASYSRGMDADKNPLMANMVWSVGFLKTIQMIKSEKLREQIIMHYENENGRYMLHPDVFLEFNANMGGDSFINMQEYYSLLPPRLKCAFSYENYVKKCEYEYVLVKKSANYRVGAMILFLPKIFLLPFRKLARFLLPRND